MSVLSLNPLALELHETNRRLRLWLERFAACSSESESRAPKPGEISALLSELLHVGESLRRRQQESVPEIEFELTQYREQVEKLRTLLPLMHRALLHERARLEQERERLNAAGQWAHVSRQTL